MVRERCLHMDVQSARPDGVLFQKMAQPPAGPVISDKRFCLLLALFQK
jgi:hypothetical protein